MGKLTPVEPGSRSGAEKNVPQNRTTEKKNGTRTANPFSPKHSHEAVVGNGKRAYTEEGEGEAKAVTIPRFKPRKKKTEEKEEEGEEKAAEEEGPQAPCLRFVGYDPKSGHKSLLIVPAVAVLEVVTTASQAVGQSELMGLLDPAKRADLARFVCGRLHLEFPRNAPPELVIDWSGANIGYIGKVDAGKKTMRPPEERTLKREGRILRTSMVLSQLQVLVSAFRQGSSNDLMVNVYYPRIQEAAELLITATTQEKCLGRSVFDFDEGEPRTTAVEWLCRRLNIKVVDDPDNAERKALEIVLSADKATGWVSAYKSLDTDVPVEKERPTGVPLKFIPANTRGDLILRKGIKLKGARQVQRGAAEVLVSVFTRAAGEPGGHGLIFEAYNADTSYTTTLHVGASELLRQVNGREELLSEMQLKDTIEAMLYRLVIKPSAVGGLDLSIDIHLMPNLFDA